MNRLPEPRSLRDLAHDIGAEVRGPERTVSVLLAPAELGDVDAATRSTAVVALFDPKAAADVLASGDVAAVVVAQAAAEAWYEAASDAQAHDDPGSGADDSAASSAGPTLLITEQPRLALAHLTRLFDTRPRPADRHPTARVADDAVLGEGVRLGAGAVVGAGARIGPGTTIGPGAVVSDGVTVGRDCRLYANVTLVDNVTLGDRVILQAGAVIGSDGYGFARGPRGAVKLHHLGGTILEDDVEVGANSVIDAGTLQPTRIGARTKIDGMCRVGHNASVGPDCLMAGFSGIAGSARLERGVVLAAGVLIHDHVTIGAGATIGMGAVVTKDVPPGERWGGYPAQERRAWIRERYLIGNLERIWAWIKDRL